MAGGMLRLLVTRFCWGDGRLDNLVKRIRVAPAFADEIGEALGINPSTPEPPDFAQETPKLTATVDPGNVIGLKFVKSGSDGIYIETNVDNDGWTFVDKATKSPVTLNIAQNPGNSPRSVMIRARFLDGNNPVGDWSDIITVQTIP